MRSFLYGTIKEIQEQQQAAAPPAVAKSTTDRTFKNQKNCANSPSSTFWESAQCSIFQLDG
jgi:hypothetical protein